MDVRIIATLPRVSMEGDELSLTNARCLHLNFDELLELEGQKGSAVYDNLGFKFRRHPPVFFEKWIEVPDQVFKLEIGSLIGHLMSHARPHIKRCVRAIHFAHTQAILNPEVAVTYFDYRSPKNEKLHPSITARFSRIGAYRAIGESGSEFTFQNSTPSLVLRQQHADSIRNCYNLLESQSDLMQEEGMEYLLEPIHTLALPGINNDVKQLLLAGALESMLVPEVRTKIAQRFIARLTALCDGVAEVHQPILSNTYKLRSAIVHGDMKEKNKILKRLGMEYGEYLHRLHRMLIIGIERVIRLSATHQSCIDRLHTLRLSLDEVVQDQTQK